MAAELGVPSSRIALSPHGVPVFPDFVRAQRHSGDLTVVFLGRMEKRKGTIDLLHAIPDVLQQVPHARFVFIGSDRPHCPGNLTHVEYFRANFSPSLRDRVSFAGRLADDEVDRRLQSADLFVAPSLYESFGLIFLEAMRWGTPVIGTDAGGIPEIITDGETGLLVPPGNPQALAARIIDLLRDAPRRLAMGRAGRRRVEQEFSVARMSQRAESLYARTMGLRQRSRPAERAIALASPETLHAMAGDR
jgi:glycosyltransferase involved in cell wall biosynthesis